MPVELWRGDITDPKSLDGVVDGIQTLVHLVGILKARDGATFHLADKLDYL